MSQQKPGSGWEQTKSGCWKYTAGKRPHRVTVFERKPGGPLYLRTYDPSTGDMQRESLGHRDFDRAEAMAHEEVSALVKGTRALEEGKAPLGTVLDLYLQNKTPRKGEQAQTNDHRCRELWERVLGADRDPHGIRLQEWEDFIEDRRFGALDPRGNPVPERERKPVRDRAVEVDLKWLRSVFRWATNWRTAQGPYLMQENPVRGFPIPSEKNPRRPVATWDRYLALREAAESHQMTVYAASEARKERSYLAELLDLAVATGRRRAALCALRYSDLRLDDGTPHGSIIWRADADKTGHEAVVPMNSLAREAVDRVLRERPGIGDAPLFPAPGNAREAMSPDLADKWLRQAEKAAGLEPMDGGLWHPYRRMWATERKGLPAQDVAKAGGWRTTRMVTDLYTQADKETTLAVVQHEARVREVKGS